MSEQLTLTLDDEVRSDAVLSDCGTYRYRLTRRWGEAPSATFVMLNPSTADASADDPTIRRCIGFAKAWGAGGLVVVNLYALRSTDPRGLWQVADPVGPENDEYLHWARHYSAENDAPIVAAWGANARPDRVEKVLSLPGMRTTLQCLGVTKAGAPRHPLYLPSVSALQIWPKP